MKEELWIVLSIVLVTLGALYTLYTIDKRKK